MSRIELDILNPRGELDVVPRDPAPRLGKLDGKKIALIDNRKTGAREFLALIGARLEKEAPGVTLVSLSKKFNEQHRMARYRERLEGIDGAVYSTGD